MAPPRHRGTGVHDEPTEPRNRNRRLPERFRDNSDPIPESDNPPEPNDPPVPAPEASKCAVKQVPRRWPVHSNQDTEFINIDEHSEVEDNDDDKAEGVERPVPRARAPPGHTLPSPMNTANSIDPLRSADKSKGRESSRDVRHFFERLKDGTTCRVCRLVFCLHDYLSI